jgi:hypothetical protein
MMANDPTAKRPQFVVFLTRDGAGHCSSDLPARLEGFDG